LKHAPSPTIENHALYTQNQSVQKWFSKVAKDPWAVSIPKGRTPHGFLVAAIVGSIEAAIAGSISIAHDRAHHGSLFSIQ
jgi:hypothetical protein